jgi:hypothetical protein
MLNIYGPVAWFSVDSGLYRVERGDAVRFVSDTELPVPLLVEHNTSLVIGQVTRLQVEEDNLTAHCVVDDTLFISLLNQLQQGGEDYRSMKIGRFLNILLPSFSSYHTKGSFVIHEISLVDVGRRIGSLWKVVPHVEEHQRLSTTRRIAIPLEQVKTRLLYLLLRQRQQCGRQARLCRDASVCGLSTDFVSASSLVRPALKTDNQQSRTMTKPNYHAKMARAFETLAKALSADDNVNDNDNDKDKDPTEQASKEAIYSSSDVKQMMLALERKQADRSELEHVMEEVVKRRVAKETVEERQPNTCKRRTGRRRDKLVEVVRAVDDDEEEDEEAEEDGKQDGDGEEQGGKEQTDNSYTSMPVSKRVHNMMKGFRKTNAKKAKLDSCRKQKQQQQQKQQQASNKRTKKETSSDSSDEGADEGGEEEEEDEEEGGATKKQSKDGTRRMLSRMDERLDQMISIMTDLTSVKEPKQQQSDQSSTQQQQQQQQQTSGPQERTSPQPSKGPSATAPRTTISTDSCSKEERRSDQEKTASDVKGSGLDAEMKEDIVGKLLSQ